MKYSAIILILFLVGCTVNSTQKELDEVLEYWENELNETESQISLERMDQGILEDKYIEEYEERYG